MTKHAIRPDVSQLQLRTYPSSLHPEFFDVHVGVRHRVGAIELGVGLGRTGHVVSVRIHGRAVTENLADKTFEPPEMAAVCECKVTRGTTRSVVLESGLRYHLACESETLAPEVFLQVGEEIALDSRRAPIMFEIPSPNRFSPPSISFATFEISSDAATIHIFHTFPQQRTIIKTQSLIELL